MGRPRVRDKIVVAARELLENVGGAALTTRAVAEQAGVTEASVFNNFGDKAGLIKALIEEQLPEFDAFREALSESPEDLGLEAWVANMLSKSRDYFAVILPLAAPQILQGAPKGRSSRSSYTGHRPLHERLASFQDDGFICPDVDTASAALLIQGAAMHGALTQITQGDDALGKNRSEWAKRVAATLLVQITMS